MTTAEYKWKWRRRTGRVSEKTLEMETLANQGLKRCSDCNEILPMTTEFFHPRKDRKKHPWWPKCKECKVDEKRKARQNETPLQTCKQRTRKLIRASLKLKGYKKTSRTHELLGASWEIVMRHLTDRGRISFDGMQIDHIVPMSLAETEEEACALNHFTNLRLITKDENKAKYNHLPEFEELPIILPEKVIQIYNRAKIR